jgi:hypothetical protein
MNLLFHNELTVEEILWQAALAEGTDGASSPTY